MAILNEWDLSPPFVEAEAVIWRESLDPSALDLGSAIFYLLSTECPFSPANYPLLNRLAKSGVPVVGVAVERSPDMVARYAEEWDLSFPVLVGASGSAIDRLPSFQTPTLLLASGGEVILVEFGKLSPGSSDFVEAIATSWTGTQDMPAEPRR